MFINKRIIIGIFLSAIFCSHIISQEWNLSYDENHLDDKAFGMVIDAAGNIYITGYVTRAGSGEDMFLAKYNAEKVQQWKRYYNGPGNQSDRAFGIVIDNSGNIIITGYSTGVGSLADFTTIKFNSQGTQLWIQRYNAPLNGDDRAFGIVVDRIGNIYVTGYITNIGTDIYTIKYNSTGVYVWGKVINGTGNQDDKAFGIVTDSLGNNIYISGYTFNTGTGNDFTVARYDTTGEIIWVNKFNGNDSTDDKAFGIVIDRNNNIWGSGYTTGAGTGMDMTVIKYSQSGITAWVNSYNDTVINGDDKAFGMVIDSDGNSYITGYTTSDTAGNTNYLTMKINPNGETLWRSVYDGPEGNDTALAICIPKRSEGVYVTGVSTGLNQQGNVDAFTIKYSLVTGAAVDSSRYNSSFNKNDIASLIVPDTSGNVYVGGYTETPSDGYNLMMLKYYHGILIGIRQISEMVPAGFELYQNYPNPFNPVTKINFDIQKTGNVRLEMFDVLGRQVNVLLDKQLKPGKYEVELDLSSFSSGVYFYRLKAGNSVMTKKMILIK